MQLTVLIYYNFDMTTYMWIAVPSLLLYACSSFLLPFLFPFIPSFLPSLCISLFTYLPLILRCLVSSFFPPYSLPPLFCPSFLFSVSLALNHILFTAHPTSSVNTIYLDSTPLNCTILHHTTQHYSALHYLTLYYSHLSQRQLYPAHRSMSEISAGLISKKYVRGTLRVKRYVRTSQVDNTKRVATYTWISSSFS